MIQNNICIVAVAQRAALPKREEHTPLLQQEAAFSVPGQTRAKDISCFRVAFAQELRLGNAIAAGFRLADGGAAQIVLPLKLEGCIRLLFTGKNRNLHLQLRGGKGVLLAAKAVALRKEKR